MPLFLIFVASVTKVAVKVVARVTVVATLATVAAVRVAVVTVVRVAVVIVARVVAGTVVRDIPRVVVNAVVRDIPRVVVNAVISTVIRAVVKTENTAVKVAVKTAKSVERNVTTMNNNILNLNNLTKVIWNNLYSVANEFASSLSGPSIKTFACLKCESHIHPFLWRSTMSINFHLITFIVTTINIIIVTINPIQP